MNINDLNPTSYSVVSQPSPTAGTPLNVNNLPPGSVTPAPSNPAPTQASRGILGNAANDIGGIFSSIFHPINTIKTLAQTALGGGEALLGHITGQTPTGGNYNTFENAANNFLGGALKGNIKGAIAKTTQDPFGMALDLASILDAGGSAVGALGDVADVGKLGELGDAAKTAGETINPINAAVKGAGAAIGKVGSKIEAPFAGSFNPDIEKTAALSDTQSAGILGNEEAGKVSGQMPISSQTGSKVVQQGEATASKGIFGKPIIDQINNTRATLNSRIQAIVDSLKTPDVPSKESIGQSYQDAAKEVETGFRNQQNAAYDAFDKKVGGTSTPAVTTETEGKLQDLIKQGQQDLYAGANPRFTSMLNKITGEDDPTYQKNLTTYNKQVADLGTKKLSPTAYNTAKEGLGPAPTPPRPDLNFNNLKVTRSTIGELAAKYNDPQLRQLYGAMSDDLTKTVQNKDPILGPQLAKLTNDYKTGLAKTNDAMIRGLQSSNKANIVDNILTQKNFNSDVLAKMKEVAPQAFQDTKNTFTNQLIEKSQTRGAFDVTKFENNLGKISPEATDQLYSPQEQDTIQKAVAAIKTNQKLLDAIKSGTKTSEGSQTAFLQKYTGLPKRVAAAAIGLFTGHPELVATEAGETALEYAGAKAFTTKIGRQALTTGFKTAGKVGGKIASGARIAGRVGQVGNITKEANP